MRDETTLTERAVAGARIQHAQLGLVQRVLADLLAANASGQHTVVRLQNKTEGRVSGGKADMHSMKKANTLVSNTTNKHGESRVAGMIGTGRTNTLPGKLERHKREEMMMQNRAQKQQ